MTINLKRSEICNLMMACTGIVIDARTEYNNTETTDDRKAVLEGTMRKWMALHDEIKEQLDEYDAKHQ